MNRGKKNDRFKRFRKGLIATAMAEKYPQGGLRIWIPWYEVSIMIIMVIMNENPLSKHAKHCSTKIYIFQKYTYFRTS